MNSSLGLVYDAFGSDHFWLTSKYHVVQGLLESIPGCDANPGRVLEVGCNTGNFLRRFQNGDTRLYGVDLNRRPLGLLKQRALDAFVTVADGVDLPFRPESFDLVLAVDVAEHVEDDRRILNQIHEILRDKGKCLVCVPAYQWLFGQHDVLFGHVRRYTRRVLVSRLESVGFTVLRSSYFQPLFVLPLWAKRRFGRGGSDLKPPNPFVNRLLDSVLRAELPILKHHDIPFGCTLIAVGQKGSR